MYKRELMQYHWEGKSVLWLLGFPSVSVIKTPLPIQKMQVQSLGHEDTPEKEMATHSSSLAWEISWMEEPGGYSPWGCKESDTTEQLTHTQTHTHTYTEAMNIQNMFIKLYVEQNFEK